MWIKCGFGPVLKRLFEYSNIFEQGFENEYSNTKIENRVFEKSDESSSVADCGKPSAAPLGAAAKASSDQTADRYHERELRAMHDRSRSDSRIDTV